MHARIEAADAAVVARIQAGADLAWDRIGLAAGDIFCLSTAVAFGALTQVDGGALDVMAVAVCVVLIAMGCIHGQWQRQGRHAVINAMALASRESGRLVRLLSCGYVWAMAVLQLSTGGSPTWAVAAAYMPVLAYGVTVTVRPRQPRERRVPQAA